MKRNQQSIEAWARNFIGDAHLSPDAILVEDLTVTQYFALTEAQRDALWERWERESENKLKHVTARRVSLNASIAG